MSNYSGALTVVGYAVGTYFGYPQLGAVVGGLVGGVADYQNLPDNTGPRLGDAQTISAAYGDVIPWIVGAGRIGGQVWWVSDRREIGTTTEQGKGGGPKNTTYTYEQDVLFGLVSHQSAGVSRIWLNGKLIWTRRTGATNESLANSDGSNLWSRITVYTGGDGQLPDPTYEAAVGAGNAPAYRGRTSVMIEGLQLGTSGQMPNLTFEVLTNSTYGISGISMLPGFSLPGSISLGSIDAGASTEAIIAVGQWSNAYETNQVNVYTISFAGEYTQFETFFKTNQYATPAIGTSDVAAMVFPYGSEFHFHTHPSWTSTYCTIGNASYLQLVYAISSNDLFVCSAWQSAAILKFSAVSGGSAVGSGVVLPIIASVVAIGDKIYAATKSTKEVYVIDRNSLSTIQVVNRPSFGDAGADSWPVLFNLDGNVGLISTLHPTSYTVSSLVNLEWVTLGALPYDAFDDGGFYPSVRVAGGVIIGVLGKTGPHRINSWITPLTFTPGAASLQSTVEALCDRAGMPSGSYDATALSAVTKPVRSLLLAQLGAARAALQPLQLAYHFDATLTDRLYFRPRATSAVATIPVEDLAAGVDKPSGEPFALTQGSDLELHAQVAVRYRNVDNDYQTGVEVSDRLLSGQVAQQSIEVALGMTPSEAKALADVMVTDNLAALTRGTISLSMAYAHLQPADVVIVDGQTMRLGRKQDARGVINFEARRHDSSTVISAGVTDSSTYVEATAVTAPSSTELVVLDIPLLRDADDGPGHYVAANGSGSTWAGCSVLRGINDYTFAQSATVLERAVFGTCTTTLPDFDGIGFDEVSSLSVDVGEGQLSSTTRDDLLLDHQINAIVVGSEVIRFITATQTSASPNIYTLTRLLRGQRGTEWAISGHVASERCALLRPQGLRYIATSQTDIGITRYIKGVSNGANPANVDAVQYINTGVSQKPFSPTNVRVFDKQNGQYVVSWQRRSRHRLLFSDGRPVSLPAAEDSEAFESVLKDSGGQIVTTKTSTYGGVTFGASQIIKTYTNAVYLPEKIGSYIYGTNTNGEFVKLDAATGNLVSVAGTAAGAISGANVIATGYSATSAYAMPMTASQTSSDAVQKKLYRYDLATMTLAQIIDMRVFDSTAAGEVFYIGGYVWTVSRADMAIRKHDPSTLAVLQTTNLGAGLGNRGPIAKAIGNVIYVQGADWNRLQAYDTSTNTTVWSVAYRSFLNVLYVSSVNLAAYDDTNGKLYLIDKATGLDVASINIVFDQFFSGVYGELLYAATYTLLSGYKIYGEVKAIDISNLSFVDAVIPSSANSKLVGTIDGNPVVMTSATGAVETKIMQEFGPGPSLAGHTVSIYQMSSTVGRGYPAEITL